ncbi:glycosyltransferase [Lactococcus nasutitermitis]|uniref:Glycosyltransferase n=1 Tax=Lactococcus nasutitermitis TaxID=1652957 RepID=A0ABV9JD36_9LACT
MLFLKKVLELISASIFFYPMVASIAWIVGGTYYRWFYTGRIKQFKRMAKEDEPMISILIPAHNEELVIEDTINYMFTELDYHNFEVLVCDDGSTDTTPLILQRLMVKYPRLRCVRITANKGKAHAFNIGASFAKGEFILSNDADIMPERDALWKYMNYFIGEKHQNTGAVTVNMTVQNRTLLIEKSQTVEFSSISGLIKRTQIAVLGAIYAYSGANTMYRKDALYDVGMFRQDRATEDISIAWDQQFQGWQAVYTPDIIAYMNVPTSVNELYKQRKRWAKGGTESWITNFLRITRHPLRYFSKVVLLFDQTLSILWAFYFIIGTITMLIKFILDILTENYYYLNVNLDRFFIFYSFVCVVGVLQLLASLILENHESRLKYIFFSPLYLLWYWIVAPITVITSFPSAVIELIKGESTGTWVSPERTKMRK